MIHFFYLAEDEIEKKGEILPYTFFFSKVKVRKESFKYFFSF